MPPGLESQNLENGPPPKRPRLAHACNLCRARKVRCDERERSCRNCELANVECITTDARSRIGAKALRRRAGAGPSSTTRAHDSPPDRADYSTYASVQSDTGTNSTLFQSLHEPQPEQRHSQHNAIIPSPAVSDSHQQFEPPYEVFGQLTGSSREYPQTALLPSQNVNFGQPAHHDRIASDKGPLSLGGQTASAISPSQDSLNVLAATSPEEAFHEDHNSFRRKWLGPSSLHVLTQWLDLSSTIYGGQPISSMFRHGMEHSEEMPLPFPMNGSDGLIFLPPIQERNDYIETVFRCLHPLFPLLDIKNFWNQLTKFDWLSQRTSDGSASPIRPIPPSDRPLLTSIYVLVSMGADEKANENTQLGEMYLTAAFSMYPHLVAMPYLPSVQALLLLSIALRERTKDGSAWHIVGQAVRIAQSLGIHRSRIGSFTAVHDPELDARVWWTAYCLEKVMNFETGRSSMIDDEDCSQNVPKPYSSELLAEERGREGLDCFSAFIGLARVQSAISKRLFRQTAIGRTSSQLLYETGQLDQMLSAWLESVPADIRPGRDLFCAPSIRSFAYFLALQYHQTLSMLHRSGLLLDTHLLQQQITIHCTDMPWRHRLMASEAICVSSARAVIRLLTEDNIDDHQSRLLLHTLTSLLLSVYVLAIYILKHPQAKTVQSDVLLLTSASQQVKARYILAGQHPEFYHMVEVLCQLASQRVANHYTRPVSPINNPAHQHILTTGFPTQAIDDISWSFTFPADTDEPQMIEELWSCVLGEDLGISPLVNGANSSLEATYQMFGLLPPRPAGV